MSTYDTSSPYYTTPETRYGLGVMVNRPVPKKASDQLFKINLTYQYRPDLLAFDLYGDSNLWWVFYQRNPNTLQTPISDFEVGVEIYLPTMNTLKDALGI